MRTLLKRIIACALMVVIVVSAFCCTSVDAYAKTTKKSKKPATVQDEVLVSLTTYLNTLVSMGASADDIAVAQKAVNDRQALLAYLEANKEALAKSQGVIFVGDSRTVQMQGAVGPTYAGFIAENSKGYNWFKDEAIPQIDARVGKGSKIVINLGVNDPGNIDNYIALVNAKTYEWTQKGATVYYATVNPVSENPYTSTEQVDMFNQKLATGLVGVNIIDTNAYIKTAGYTLIDGLHYNEATYQKLYSYMLSRM